MTARELVKLACAMGADVDDQNLSLSMKLPNGNWLVVDIFGVAVFKEIEDIHKNLSMAQIRY